MAQQINLHSPILLGPRLVFSARAMVQALGVLAIGLAALVGWTMLATRSVQQEVARTRSVYADEQKRVLAFLAEQPAAGTDPAALTQQLAQARLQLEQRRGMLAELAPPADQIHRQSALLMVIARTVPDAVWLREVGLQGGGLSLAGTTLQPAELRRWLARLAAEPALAGQALREVKVEHDEGGGPETWSFQVLSRMPGSDAS